MHQVVCPAGVYMSVQCSKCGQEAIYFRRYTGERLCRGCLILTTIERVRRTVNKGKLLKENDRIAVGVSGGKDSAVLLDVLSQIEQNYPQSEIIAITIDEGIKGYRDRALDAARELVTGLGLELQVFTFKDEFGHSLDEIISLRTETEDLGACSYCGVFRRRALNSAALKVGADVVATGHNMDDEAQTVVMNVLRGDSKRLVRANRARDYPIEGLVPRIKPIVQLSERDIVAYAHFKSLPYHDVPCPYASEAYRNDVRAFLNDMEHKRPGTLTAILRSGDSISEILEQTLRKDRINSCSVCGSPTPSSTCKVCRLLARFNNEEGAS
jgi:uncharacterized protein (TIGR00269 family)